MTPLRPLAAATLLVLYVATLRGAAVSGQSGVPSPVFPEGAGRELALRACKDCHVPTDITRRRESRHRWSVIVSDMIKEGADVRTDDEFDVLVRYLSVTLGRRIRINEVPARTIAETFDISESDAALIVRHRTDKGPFKSWKDIASIPGINAARVEEQKENLDFGGGPAQSPQPPAPQPARTVYVSAIDGRGQPVLDLGAGDFTVKEDGRTRQILTVEPATEIVQLAIVVDDNGTGMFRYGLAGLAELLQGRAEISLRAVTGQVLTLFDFTPDARAWMAGLSRLGARPGSPEGGHLLSGISEAARDLRGREARRPVILAVTVGGDEQSSLLARHVLDQLHQSRAALHVVFAESPAVRPGGVAGKPADLLENNFDLSRVLGDGPKQSGGRRRDVLAAQAVQNEIQQVARDLLRQYAVTYARPAGAGTPGSLDVAIARRGVKAVAPSRAPAL